MTNEGGSSNKALAVLTTILAGSALLLATVAVIGGGDRAAATATKAEASPQTVKVELGDIFIKPKGITAKAGTDVVLEVTNTGKLDHDLAVKGGPSTPMLKPGQTAT
ncbi:MAG: hypothetical protein O2822_06860, partial [Chloroflexi bacterium]|nr:hypothetical protein [Chloroflexota bacterium]